jgi:hypothetical protein
MPTQNSIRRHPMIVAEYHSHKNGLKFIEKNYPNELAEVHQAVKQVDAVSALRKKSDEATKPALLFSPPALNKAMKMFLHPLGWTDVADGGKKGFREPRLTFADSQFREMDGIKNHVGLEIQFGKYAFMGYDIFSKMPIFNKHGLIKCGIEVVAMPRVVQNMSTGVSSFNQIRLDMVERGEADLDIPTLIIGIDCTGDEWDWVAEKRRRYLNNPKALIESGEVDGARVGAKPGPKSY